MFRTHWRGIDEQDVGRIRSFAHIDGEEVLTNTAPGEEVAAVANDRRAQLIGAEQRFDASGETRLVGKIVEKRVGVGIFPIDPCPRLRAVLIFEPSVGVGDLDTLNGFCHGTRFGLWRGWDLLVDRLR